MPSTEPLPTVSDLRQASAQALVGQFDPYANTRLGSLHDQTAGPSALLMARQAAVDRDKFRAIYIDEATGKDLTNVITNRLGVPRILDTYGQGTCSFARPNATAGAGTFWTGTRVQVSGVPAVVYQVAEDTPVSGTTCTVPIEATTFGVGTAINAATSLTLLDPVYDPTWAPTSLTCADGTNFEDAADYRARARQTVQNNRNGYLTAMTTACQNAGAVYVVAFASNYGLTADDFEDDAGLNAIYVADANFGSSPALVQACAVALDAVRVLGCDLWVGGIQTSPLTVNATISLTDDPGKFPLLVIQRAIVQALIAYFSGSTEGYVYKRTAMAGAVTSKSTAVQTVTFNAPTSDPLLPENTPPVVQEWPATLTRWTLGGQNIFLNFTGPV